LPFLQKYFGPPEKVLSEETVKEFIMVTSRSVGKDTFAGLKKIKEIETLIRGVMGS
jgi:hypothetical protein